MLSDIGIGLIVMTVLAFDVLLIDDGYRVLTGHQTFTDWADRKTYRKWLFVAGACALPVGMFLHLFG